VTRPSLFAYRGQSSGRSDLVLGICAFIGFIGIWTLIWARAAAAAT
jgi:hypothetical protein